MAAMKPFIVEECTAPVRLDQEILTTTKKSANGNNEFDTKFYLEFLDDQREDIIRKV